MGFNNTPRTTGCRVAADADDHCQNGRRGEITRTLLQFSYHDRLSAPHSALRLLPVTLACAQTMPPLEQLFTRRFVRGTQPPELRWPKSRQALFFLWNSEGRRAGASRVS